MREEWGAPGRTEAEKMKADDEVSCMRSKRIKVESQGDLEHDDNNDNDDEEESNHKCGEEPGFDWN